MKPPYEITIEPSSFMGKYQRIVDARILLCHFAVRELGSSMASLSRRLELSVLSVSDSIKREQTISEEKRFNLLKSQKPDNLTAFHF